jgi:hypothetical protein
MVKFLVTGDRDWVNREVIYKRLAYLPNTWYLVHGGARGADSIAHEFWSSSAWAGLDHVLVYEANWTRWGKKAGPIRNKQMLNENPEIELVIAFNNDISASKGTKDMVMQSIRKGIPVEIITEGTYGTFAYDAPEFV